MPQIGKVTSVVTELETKSARSSTSFETNGGNVEDSGSDEVTSFRKIDQAHTFVGYVWGCLYLLIH